MKRTENYIVLLIGILLLSGAVQAIGLGTLDKKIVYTPGETASITYYLVNDKNENLSYTLNFSGTLSPYVSFDLERPKSWYSGFGTDLDTYLVREIDLSTVSEATLNFYTKYKIEYGWDFGYIEVSTNNGTSWNQIAATSTTTYRDGAAYVGVPGAPAYTGEVANWTYETANLTPFVGNTIKLRFRYVTDTYYAESGWFIDDIKIPEIGFFDDVTGGENNWATDGWQITDRIESVTSETKTSPIILNFNIPATYVYNNSEENLILKQIHWSGENFIPSYESFPQIIVRLPPLEKYLPPISGGGGGGGTPASYTRTIGAKISYYASQMTPTKTEKITPGRPIDSPVTELAVLVKRILYNVQIDIIPLPGRPADIIDRLEDVYRYIEIKAPKLEEKNLKEAKIRFFITGTWMEENGAGPEDIVLMRNHLGDWEDLPTTNQGMDGPNYVFEATTPGFSVFAIAKRQDLPSKVTVEPKPTERPLPPDFDELLIIGNETVKEQIKEDILKKTKPADEPEEGTETQLEMKSAQESPAHDLSPAEAVAERVASTIETISERLTGKKTEIETVDVIEPARNVYRGLVMTGMLLIIFTLATAGIIYRQLRKRKKR